MSENDQMFNAAEFLSTSQSDQLDTALIPFPVGEHDVQIDMTEDAIKIEQGKSGPNAKHPGKPWARIDILATALDPTGAIKSEMKREPKIRIGIMLDLDERGRFDGSRGKNVRFGALLAAAGLNQSGWKANDLKGKLIKVKVVHEMYEGNPQANVKSFAPVGN